MVYCSALNCRNATSGINKNSSVSFYGFPLENKPLLEQWIQNMGRDMETPSRFQRLCSDHFEESCFERDPSNTHRHGRLLHGAVPKKFILGGDGSWLLGTPQNFWDTTRNKPWKRIRNPEPWLVCEKFPNGAEWPTLEDWQNEFYKTVLKELYGSLATVGKDYPIPKSKILAGEAASVKNQQDLQGRKSPASLGAGCGGAMITSQLQRGEATQLHGSSPGGFQNLPWNLSDKGETSGSHQTPTNPWGTRGGSGFPAQGQLGESKQHLFHQEMHPTEPEVPWFICTDCGKSFARHVYLVRHRKIHCLVKPHQCTECGKGFVEKHRLKNHLRTHSQAARVLLS